uniref:Docking protein 2 n=1 Tax=Pundamilia nyererei TaxID=303518 RepID=A0A3B4G944_9CICH
MEEDIRKQGVLYLQQQRFGKKWKRVWCVLYRESSCSISRLEFYECKDGGNAEKNDKTLRKQQEHKKVIRLADCIRVTEVEMEGCPKDTGSFLVETTEKIYVFAADRNHLDDWTHKLCEIAFPTIYYLLTTSFLSRRETTRSRSTFAELGLSDNNILSDQSLRDFRVSIRRTEASDRCRLKGDGVLRAGMDALHLLDKGGDIVYTWPYRYLRRFGRDKATFSFEAGRRCDSGEGNFEFDTKQGNVLFQAVEAAINLQKVAPPHRQTSGGGQEGPLFKPASRPRAVGVSHNERVILTHFLSCSQCRLEPPVDKTLTGVKSLNLDSRLPAPRKNQVKMISSCPLPNPEQTYSQITMSTERGTKREKRSANVAAPCTGSEADYSLPFDTIAKNVLTDILNSHRTDSGHAGADPLYDSIDEMKIRNVFTSDGDTVKTLDHIYDEPEGCAAAAAKGQKSTLSTSVYDDPEEMRGDAWRIMGTAADPKGHEYPYNPRVDDYAVPKQAQRAFPKSQSSNEEDSPYNNVMVKMA